MVSQSKFSVTLPRVWICISPLLGLFVSRRGCFESRRICFVSRRRCFESRRICFAPFLGLFASRRSCFAPRSELKNAIWTVLVLCTKHDYAIEHLSPSKPQSEDSFINTNLRNTSPIVPSLNTLSNNEKNSPFFNSFTLQTLERERAHGRLI